MSETMESISSLTQLSTLLTIALMLVFFVPNTHAGQNDGKPRIPPFRPGPWGSTRATFYGGADGSGTKGGACGYEDPFELGYGSNTTSIGSSMFKDGLTCGSCYELKCVDKTGCKPGSKSITVTATNTGAIDGTFDLAEPAFVQIAEHNAGIVPIQYRRVPCRRQGGIRFSIKGNENFNLVSITNVGGAGDISQVQVKGSENLPWTSLRRNWGTKWQADVKLIGRKLTFRVMTSDGKTITSRNVFPKDWQFGKTYEGKSNFSRAKPKKRSA